MRGELQLGHKLGPIKRAYLRTDLLAERAGMMEAWAMYLRGELPDDWDWISPKAAAKLKALEQERNEIREERDKQAKQLEALTETVNEIAASLKASEVRSTYLADMLTVLVAGHGTEAPESATDPRLGKQSEMAL